MKRRQFYFLLLSVALVAAPHIHAQSAVDPWSKVVALPTACYQSQDQFAAKNQAALEALSAEHKKQNEINSKAPKISDGDPMELARRIQEAMMKDPQAAMKMMQQSGAANPAATQAETQQMNAKHAKWDADREALLGRLKTATGQAYAPGLAQFKALQKKVGGDPNSPFLPESGTPAWASAEADTIKRNMDKQYAALCPQYFGAGGSMLAFMQRYKDYLVQERIPYMEKIDGGGNAINGLLGTSTGGYKSTAALEAVEDYVKMAAALFGSRELTPRCSAAGCKEGF